MDNKNIYIEFFLIGGHVILGWITDKQFTFLMNSLQLHGGGIMPFDDSSGYEVTILIDHIAAIRYPKVTEE